MTTGATHAIFETQRTVGTQDLRERFQERLSQSNIDTRAKVWPVDGIFNGSISFNLGLDDAFGLVEDVESTDGEGNILRHAEATDDCTDVPYENTLNEVYHVGLRSCRRPIGIEINARTGMPMYQEELEDVGDSGDPSSVVDNGNGTITFNVNSVCESGRNFSGRTVVVFMKVPAAGATTEAIAIESLEVSYAAPNNTITTTAALGQTTISTDAADYTVVMLGPTVRADEDLSTVDGVVYIGTLTGGGPNVPPAGSDTSAQNDIDVDLSQLHTILDNFTGPRLLRPTRAGQRDATFTARTGVAAVLHPDTGEIYVMGGNTNPTGMTASALNDAFNPATNTWTSRTVVPSQSNGGAAVGARRWARAASLGGIIYLIGGNDGTADYELVQRYEPATNTWLTPAADLPATRSAGIVGVIDGMIYYAGGFSTNGTVGHDNTYQYDPDMDSWTEVAAISTAVTMEVGHAAFAVAPSADGDDRLYMFGGDDLTDEHEEVLEYNPDLDQWVQRADIPRPPGNGAAVEIRLCQAMAAVTVNGVIHLLGGSFEGRSGQIDFSRKHLIYNPALDEHSYLDDIMSPAVAGAVAVADDEGFIYTGFGLLPGGAANVLADYWHGFAASTIFRADNAGIAADTGRLATRTGTGSSTWQTAINGETIAPIPSPRWNSAFCTLDRVVYMLGGLDDSGAGTDTLFAYYVDTNTWCELEPYPGGEVVGASLVADPGSKMLWKVRGLTAADVADTDVRNYDPDTNTWSGILATIAAGGRDSTTTLIGDRIYMFGYDIGVSEAATCVFFDIALLTTVALANIPTINDQRAMMNREGVVVRRTANGNLVRPDDDGGAPEIWYWAGQALDVSLDEIIYYDVETDTHNVVSESFASPRTGSNGKLLIDPDTGDQFIYIGPGVNIGTGLASSALYDLNSGELILNGGAEDRRWGYALAELDGRLFMFGGSADFTSPPPGAGNVDDLGQYLGVFAWPARAASGLENFSAYNLNAMTAPDGWTGTSNRRRRARRVRRDCIAFNEGEVWGLGTWDPEAQADIIKQGEE